MSSAQKAGLAFFDLMKGRSQDVSALIGRELVTVSLRGRDGVFYVETVRHPGAQLDIHVNTPSLTEARASFTHQLSVAFSHEYRVIRRNRRYSVEWEAGEGGRHEFRAYEKEAGFVGASPVAWGAWMICFEHRRKEQIALYLALRSQGINVAKFARDNGMSRSGATRLIQSAAALYNDNRLFHETDYR